MKFTTLLMSAAAGVLLSCGNTASDSKDANATPATTKPAETATKSAETSAATSKPSESKGRTINEIIPQGYEILLQEKGDINDDKVADLVLILRDKREENEPDNESLRRPLLLLLGEKDGGYTLARRNDNAIYCVTCGGTMGDPVQGITIKSPYFSIENVGGSGMRWLHVVTFKYDATDKEWYLHRDGHESFHSAEPEKILEKSSMTTKNFGNVKFEKYDIEAKL